MLSLGLTVRGLGLVPATVVTALLTALASSRTSILTAVAIAAGLVAVRAHLRRRPPTAVAPVRSVAAGLGVGAQMELLDNLALGLWDRLAA